MRRAILFLIANILAIGGLTLFTTTTVASDHDRDHHDRDHRDVHHRDHDADHERHEWLENQQCTQPSTCTPIPSSCTPYGSSNSGYVVPQYVPPTVYTPYYNNGSGYVVPQYQPPTVYTPQYPLPAVNPSGYVVPQYTPPTAYTPSTSSYTPYYYGSSGYPVPYYPYGLGR